jgi:hypothetical protein
VDVTQGDIPTQTSTRPTCSTWKRWIFRSQQIDRIRGIPPRPRRCATARSWLAGTPPPPPPWTSWSRLCRQARRTRPLLGVVRGWHEPGSVDGRVSAGDRPGIAVSCGVGWWACQDLNLGPHPYQQMHGTAVLTAVLAGRVGPSRSKLCALIASCYVFSPLRSDPALRPQRWTVLGNAAAIWPTVQHPLRNPTMERSQPHGQPDLEE